ncbi:MAG TPA: hypothetical protein VHY35_04365 [Stellaceae bacterium]|jgi:hypothetical protein|nr:hypothetical protein [Stellaceae bacterium]
MKWIALSAALLAGTAIMPVSSANAAGCIKGAVVGGVAGHFANHHGLLGAGIGCAIGHHEAAKHERQRQRDHYEAERHGYDHYR